MKQNEGKTSGKRVKVMIVCVVLSLVLCAAVAAAILSMVERRDNYFQTARVSIDLNGGESVFDGSDMNVEPGMRLARDFTITNNSTVDVWYRLYLDNISGKLTEAMDLSIYDGDELLFKSAMSEMTVDRAFVAEAALGVNETVTLTAIITMRPTSGNVFMNEALSFELRADAVQVRNNPDKLFN